MSSFPDASRLPLTGDATRAGPRRVRDAVAWLLITIWAVPLLLIGSALMVGHWVTLPVPERGNPVLQSALASLRGEEARWQLAHFLYAQCGCSHRVIDYLMTRPTPEGAVDHVVLVGEHEALELKIRARGIGLTKVSRDDLARRFDVQSAPLLAITDPQAQVRYVGGYTARKQGLDYRDLSLLEALRHQHRMEGLPLYGCGVSKALQAYLDPLGVKYER